MFSTKDICRGMAKPEEKEMIKMKRLARYKVMADSSPSTNGKERKARS